MGSLSPAGARRLLRALALSALVIGGLATLATAAGPGGWDHLGDRGTPGITSLDLVASALAVTPGALYVGGDFTDAGGVAEADRIATWNAATSTWSAVSSATSQIWKGGVLDIAVYEGKVYAGGSFTDAGPPGGVSNADFLAVWNGMTWEPFCNRTGGGTGPVFDGNVTSLEIVGQTLYVGGEFHNGAGFASADYLLACDLVTGVSRSTVADQAHAFFGSVYALTADSNGTLYAGGGFTNLGDPATGADFVAQLPAGVGGTWQAMGAGGGAVTSFVRGLTAVGADVYVGTDANDVAGISQADHVAKWNASGWSAVGSDSSGGNGWFPASNTSIKALAGDGSSLFVTGSFQNADGDARADNVAFFDGTNWHPVGSNGGSDGPWSGTGHALAIVDRQLFAAGSFTSAGGDNMARSVASFSLAQIIAYPTPTVTPGPSAQPTPTVTPGPSPQPTPTVTPSPTPPDTTAPTTSLRKAQISQAQRKATFSFASGEPGSKFLCRLDNTRLTPCVSPKTYKKLKPGKHVFRVKARDRAGNLDATPAVRRFKIKKR
jgi:hypothetical protein